MRRHPDSHGKLLQLRQRTHHRISADRRWYSRNSGDCLYLDRVIIIVGLAINEDYIGVDRQSLVSPNQPLFGAFLVPEKRRSTVMLATFCAIGFFFWLALVIGEFDQVD